MPRYAITQTRALTTIYSDAQDALAAVNWARRVLIDHARHGNLEVSRLPDTPYDEGDGQSELRYEHPDDERDEAATEAARMPLERAESAVERTEQW